MFCFYQYYLIFLFSLFIRNSKCILFGPMLGPADLEFQYLEYCDAKQIKGIDFTIAKRKYNRTMHVFDLHLETEYDIEDTLIIEFKGFVKKDGGYKQGSRLIKKPLCEALHLTLGENFNQYLNATGRKDCPIPAGSYETNNFFLDNTSFTVPKVYGEYKTEFTIWNGDVLIRCFNCYYKYIPKSDI